MKACILVNTILLKMMDKDKVVRPIRMQKLLYYFLGFYSKEISLEEFKDFIEEDFEAWKYGPVIPKLYYQLKHYGRRPISRFIEEDNKILCLETNDIQERILDNIVIHYGHMNDYELSDLTHQHDTWKRTDINNIITKEHIKSFFEGMYYGK